MQQLLEYVSAHPFLASAAVLMLIVVVVHEWRARTRDFASIPPAEAVRLMNQGGVLIDIRKPTDYVNGHIAGSRNIPGEMIAEGAKNLEKYKEKPVVAYCDTGMTAGSAARHLARLGFRQVYNLRGGLAAWRQENLP
ncbi:MAG: rhodanese-like domain-containing protein, partial [Pseudomonadota bacterium]